MALINPHINFNGNAEEAFTFYKSVFGGEFAKIIRFKDIASAEFPVAEKEENKIMHIALPIGKSNRLMAKVSKYSSRLVNPAAVPSLKPLVAIISSTARSSNFFSM